MIKDRDVVVLQHTNGGFFLAVPSSSHEQQAGLELANISFTEALRRPDAWLEVVSKDGYIGLRSSHAAWGKLLQARRKGNPFGFSSTLFGTWEQWQTEVAQEPVEESLIDHTEAIKLTNRRLPSVQLLVYVHKLAAHAHHPRQPYEAPPTPQLKPRPTATPQQQPPPFYPNLTPTPHLAPYSPSLPPDLDTPSYLTPALPNQGGRYRMQPTPALPSRQTAFTPMLPHEHARQAYSTPEPQPWPETTPEPPEHLANIAHRTPTTEEASLHLTRHTQVTQEVHSSAHKPHMLSLSRESHGTSARTHEATANSESLQAHGSPTPSVTAHAPELGSDFSTCAHTPEPEHAPSAPTASHMPQEASLQASIHALEPVHTPGSAGAHSPGLGCALQRNRHTPEPASTPHIATHTQDLERVPIASMYTSEPEGMPDPATHTPQPSLQGLSRTSKPTTTPEASQQLAIDPFSEPATSTPAVGSVSDSPLIAPSTIHHAHRRRQHLSGQPPLLPLLLHSPAAAASKVGCMGNKLGLWDERQGKWDMQDAADMEQGNQMLVAGLEEWYREDAEGQAATEEGSPNLHTLQDDVLDLSARMVRGFVARVAKAPLYIVFKLWSGWARRAVARQHAAASHSIYRALHQAMQAWKLSIAHRQYKLSRSLAADALCARLLHSHLVHLLMAWLRLAMRKAAQGRAVNHMQRNKGYRTQSKILAAWIVLVEDAWYQGQHASGHSMHRLVRKSWAAWHVYLQGTYAVAAAADAMQWARMRQQATYGLVAWRAWVTQRTQLRSLAQLLTTAAAARKLSQAWYAWQGHCFRAAVLHEASLLATAHHSTRVLQAAFSYWSSTAASRTKTREAGLGLQQILGARVQARVLWVWSARTRYRKAMARDLAEQQDSQNAAALQAEAAAVKQVNLQDQHLQQQQQLQEMMAASHASRTMLRACMCHWCMQTAHRARNRHVIDTLTAQRCARICAACLASLRVSVEETKRVQDKVEHLLHARQGRAKAQSWGVWCRMVVRVRGLRAACCQVASKVDAGLKGEALQAWACYALRAGIMRRKARSWAAVRQHRSLAHCFVTWLQSTEEAKAAEGAAEALCGTRRLRLKRSAFLYWLQLAASTSKFATTIARHLAARRAVHTAHAVFACWREAARAVWKERAHWLLQFRVLLAWATWAHDGRRSPGGSNSSKSGSMCSSPATCRSPHSLEPQSKAIAHEPKLPASTNIAQAVSPTLLVHPPSPPWQHFPLPPAALAVEPPAPIVLCQPGSPTKHSTTLVQQHSHKRGCGEDAPKGQQQSEEAWTEQQQVPHVVQRAGPGGIAITYVLVGRDAGIAAGSPPNSIQPPTATPAAHQAVHAGEPIDRPAEDHTPGGGANYASTASCEPAAAVQGNAEGAVCGGRHSDHAHLNSAATKVYNSTWGAQQHSTSSEGCSSGNSYSDRVPPFGPLTSHASSSHCAWGALSGAGAEATASSSGHDGDHQPGFHPGSQSAANSAACASGNQQQAATAQETQQQASTSQQAHTINPQQQQMRHLRRTITGLTSLNHLVVAAAHAGSPPAAGLGDTTGGEGGPRNGLKPLPPGFNPRSSQRLRSELLERAASLGAPTALAMVAQLCSSQQVALEAARAQARHNLCVQALQLECHIDDPSDGRRCGLEGYDKGGAADVSDTRWGERDQGARETGLGGVAEVGHVGVRHVRYGDVHVNGQKGPAVLVAAAGKGREEEGLGCCLQPGGAAAVGEHVHRVVAGREEKGVECCLPPAAAASGGQGDSACCWGSGATEEEHRHGEHRFGATNVEADSSTAWAAPKTNEACDRASGSGSYVSPGPDAKHVHGPMLTQHQPSLQQQQAQHYHHHHYHVHPPLLPAPLPSHLQHQQQAQPLQHQPMASPLSQQQHPQGQPQPPTQTDTLKQLQHHLALLEARSWEGAEGAAARARLLAYSNRHCSHPQAPSAPADPHTHGLHPPQYIFPTGAPSPHTRQQQPPCNPCSHGHQRPQHLQTPTAPYLHMHQQHPPSLVLPVPTSTASLLYKPPLRHLQSPQRPPCHPQAPQQHRLQTRDEALTAAELATQFHQFLSQGAGSLAGPPLEQVARRRLATSRLVQYGNGIAGSALSGSLVDVPRTPQQHQQPYGIHGSTILRYQQPQGVQKGIGLCSHKEGAVGQSNGGKENMHEHGAGAPDNTAMQAELRRLYALLEEKKQEQQQQQQQADGDGSNKAKKRKQGTKYRQPSPQAWRT